jgi:hypothetical protein
LLLSDVLHDSDEDEAMKKIYIEKVKLAGHFISVCLGFV